jgi:hypothetical protein
MRQRAAIAACLAILVTLPALRAASALAEDAIVPAAADFFLQSGTGHLHGPFTGAYNVNTLLGAPRFYNAGFTGSGAVAANIEAGYIWSGHETLGHVGQIPISPGALGDVDRHATWVAMVLGGRTGGAVPGPYQQGIAPGAQLFSGAIATSWPAGNPSFPRFTGSFFFNANGISTYGPFHAAIANGITGAGGTRTADVVNVSWSAGSNSASLTGTDRLSGTLDAIVNANPQTLITVAAGNTLGGGAGPNRVPSPATAYNKLTVASLAANGGAFDVVSTFSNGGPNDYSDPIRGVIPQARQVVDIAAPGESVSTAYYGGETGGNGPSVFGPPNGPAGGPDYYSRSVTGTSLSAPTVAGGAALLYDAAYSALPAAPAARDARVMKAVLMNSAEKTQGWNNGQVAHPNGNGGVLTTQGLDNRVGAGRMDLDGAFDQFLAETADVAGTTGGPLGAVAVVGWDFGLVAQGITNDYLFDRPLAAGSTFAATLSWFRDRDLIGLTNYTDASYDNLDLELWSAIGGTAGDLIAESRSLYNNSEHFSFAIPTTGAYLLRVRWTEQLFDLVGDVNSEFYGLAWAGMAVPEPATGALCAFVLAALSAVRRRLF